MKAESNATPSSSLMRFAEVSEAVQLKRSSIYRGVRRGDFPRPVRVTGKAVRWRRADIEHWIASREAA